MGFINTIIDIFNSPFFVLIGGLSTVAMIFTFVYVAYLVIKGVLPVWYRLGIGLSKRKIAILASSEYSSLKSMLVDSKIFDKDNIFQINKNDLKKIEDENFLLVHWKEFQDKIKEILNLKKDATALIVYAPQDEGRIDQQTLDEINTHRNTIVVNLRGRLLNDIVVSLITSGYKR